MNRRSLFKSLIALPLAALGAKLQGLAANHEVTVKIGDRITCIPVYCELDKWEQIEISLAPIGKAPLLTLGAGVKQFGEVKMFDNMYAGEFLTSGGVKVQWPQAAYGALDVFKEEDCPTCDHVMGYPRPKFVRGGKIHRCPIHA